MKKLVKLLLLITLIGFACQGVTLLRDRQALHNGLIRLHVVANSDSEADQAVKLQVRDAVIEYVDMAMSHVMTLEEAKTYIQENLPQIEAAANEMLAKLGVAETATATFMEEAFPVREYDTFSLPSGVYDSLRITIGDGEGKNWWCVVFPGLCFQATTDGVEDVAAGAGFSEELTDTVTRREGYEIRFFFLDVLGKIENFFFGA